MDMNVTMNTLTQNIANSKNFNVNGANINVGNIDANPNIKLETQEKVMMDLKDVQNFLYMLIGSELRVESDNNIGSTINKTA